MLRCQIERLREPTKKTDMQVSRMHHAVDKDVCCRRLGQHDDAIAHESGCSDRQKERLVCSFCVKALLRLPVLKKYVKQNRAEDVCVNSNHYTVNLLFAIFIRKDRV